MRQEAKKDCKAPKRPYSKPTLRKRRRLAEVTEGAAVSTVTSGGGGIIITPTGGSKN